MNKLYVFTGKLSIADLLSSLDPLCIMQKIGTEYFYPGRSSQFYAEWVGDYSGALGPGLGIRVALVEYASSMR